MQTDDRHIGLREYLRFYLPLAATGMMLMANHSTVSSAAARTAEPAIALASYAAAYSVGNMFEIACFGMQRMGLTFIKGKKSFRVVWTTALRILGVLLAAMALLSWTPVSEVLTERVLGLSPRVAQATIVSLRIMLLWPAMSAIRSIFQSLVVVGKRTAWTTVAMGMRLVATLIAAAYLPKIWPNGPVGAVILVGGLATEMLISAFAAMKVVPPLQEEPADEPLPTRADVLRFFLPLVFAQMVTPLVRSIMIGSLARTGDAELAISGYQVATSVSGVLGAATINMFQAVLVFVRGRDSFRAVRKYSLALGAISGVAILACSYPALGTAVFTRVVGAPVHIAQRALGTLTVLALTPVIAANSEFNMGILMLKKRTVWVTAAKFTNAGVCALTIVTLSRLFPGGGALLAAIASVSGVAAEAVLSHITIRRLPECTEYLAQRDYVA